MPFNNRNDSIPPPDTNNPRTQLPSPFFCGGSKLLIVRQEIRRRRHQKFLDSSLLLLPLSTSNYKRSPSVGNMSLVLLLPWDTHRKSGPGEQDVLPQIGDWEEGRKTLHQDLLFVSFPSRPPDKWSSPPLNGGVNFYWCC